MFHTRLRSFFSFAFVALIGFPVLADTPNELTPSEKASGWELLFDGQDFDGWRNYKSDSVSSGWKVVDGAMVRSEKGAGDLITKDQYKYFELSLEYRISPGGNSGLMFHVSEDEKKPWMTGPEIQIQDNVEGHDPQLSGWLYQLYKPVPPRWVTKQDLVDSTRPAGQWNQLYLRISAGGCEVCMNGLRYYTFKLGNKDWKNRVAKSKFAKFAKFGANGKGHVCLQDHGNEVAFRSVKVRRIGDDGSVPPPITGKLGLGSELAFPNLTWDQWEPISDEGRIKKFRLMELTFPKDGSNRLFAAAQSGQIYCFENRRDVAKSKLVLDLSKIVSDFNGPGGNEQGLLGFAFHPDFKSNGHFFTYYTDQKDWTSVIMRWSISKSDPDVADPNSGLEIMRFKQPFRNHNGGSIEFGPDGYLYVGTGDGGDRNDPLKSAQNKTSLLGKILRIDVNGSTASSPYAIPADNPFVDDKSVRGEIYAYGLRNPWRIAFDPADGTMWVADVGQELWEEVNIVEKGGNYGWSVREGLHPFGNWGKKETKAIDPVWEYDHQIGKSITGGRVYRSDRIPALNGKYLYADYVTGTVWALDYDASTKTVRSNDQVIPSSIPILAFGQDQKGEVYFLITSAKGESIHRFTPPQAKKDVASK